MLLFIMQNWLCNKFVRLPKTELNLYDLDMDIYDGHFDNLVVLIVDSENLISLKGRTHHPSSSNIMNPCASPLFFPYINQVNHNIVIRRAMAPLYFKYKVLKKKKELAVETKSFIG